MSLNTKCSECGEWFPIGAKHSVGEPCHRCKQKKAQFAAEISATYEKNKSKAIEVGTQIHTALLQAEAFKRFSDEHPGTYVVPADAPMVPGRKLTQELLEAGRQHREGHNDLAFYDESKAKWQDPPVTIDQAPAPRRSFVSTTALVAFWIVLAVTVAIWIFAGVKS